MHGTKPVANMRCAMHGKRTSEEQGRKPRSYASAKLCPVTESQSQRVELKILHLLKFPSLEGAVPQLRRPWPMFPSLAGNAAFGYFKMQLCQICEILASKLKQMQVLGDEWRYILDKVLGKGPEHCESKGIRSEIKLISSSSNESAMRISQLDSSRPKRVYSDKLDV